jgi:elongation factor 3
VGQNGVGKSTLLARIHQRDIANFPDIAVAFVRQDDSHIWEQENRTVTETVLAACMQSKTPEEVSTLLANVGFNDQLQQSSAHALSGGWRMKLALTCVLVKNCDLLLLDEPTNHLDKESVTWLSRYVVSLPSTTVIMVSHDYEFLSKTVTDVIHMDSQTLTYYPKGWQAFAAQCPAVIAALPVKQNASYFAHVTGEADAGFFSCFLTVGTCY